METKQTALEWLEGNLIKRSILFRLNIEDQIELMKLVSYAKRIEKQQIKNANMVGMSIGYNDNIEDLSRKYYEENYERTNL